jgi:hypothetical protein
VRWLAFLTDVASGCIYVGFENCSALSQIRGPKALREFAVQRDEKVLIVVYPLLYNSQSGEAQSCPEPPKEGGRLRRQSQCRPTAGSPTTAAAAPSSAFRAFPRIGRFIPCNSLDERRLLRLARAQLRQDRLRALGDVEHDRRASPGSRKQELRRLIDDADVILFVGARTNHNGTDSWTLFPPRARYIHIDIDSVEVGRVGTTKPYGSLATRSSPWLRCQRSLPSVICRAAPQAVRPYRRRSPRRCVGGARKSRESQLTSAGQFGPSG